MHKLLTLHNIHYANNMTTKIQVMFRVSPGKNSIVYSLQCRVE